MSNTKNKRYCGIDLLKILSIFLIIISHVAMDCGNNNYYEVGYSTNNIEHLLITMLRYLGTIGNDVFFICTSYFVIEKKYTAINKIVCMIGEIFFFSIFSLFLVFCSNKSILNTKLIIKSLLPTSFSNNWYTTCYLIFYAVFPHLNTIIEKMGQNQLFRSCVLLTFIYVFYNSIFHGVFHSDILIVWITIYFDIYYIKKYSRLEYKNKKFFLIMFVLSVTFLICIIVFSNYLGMKYSIFRTLSLYWLLENNPLILIISYALFKLFLGIKIENTIIKKLSSLTLFVYIIHENLLFRNFYRFKYYIMMTEKSGGGGEH